jgi:1-deoxy-D-xylulose-5-phosphate synthase
MCSWSPWEQKIVELARQAGLIVTIEDGVVTGGAGSRIAQTLRETGIDTRTREIGVPTEFLDHGNVGDVKARIGLTPENIGHRVIGWASSSASVDDPPTPTAEAQTSTMPPSAMMI